MWDILPKILIAAWMAVVFPVPALARAAKLTCSYDFLTQPEPARLSQVSFVFSEQSVEHIPSKTKEAPTSSK